MPANIPLVTNRRHNQCRKHHHLPSRRRSRNWPTKHSTARTRLQERAFFNHPINTRWQHRAPDPTFEIENGVHQLETLLEATVDKAFDKFEIYTLRNILTIPDDLAPWMRLGHYEVCFVCPSPAEMLSLERNFLLVAGVLWS